MNRQTNRRSGSSQRSMLPSALRVRRGPRQLFFRMGPVTVGVCSVLLISLMAIFYLSQLGQAVTVNQQIQDLRNQQAVLQRQDNDLVNTIAQEQSPAYIAAHAKALGLVPADPQNVQVIVLPHLQNPTQGDQSNQP
jgi:cell division protein FtsL